MSKTDKTRPWWVRKQDHKLEYPRLTDDTYTSYKTYKWWLGEMKCGCPICSGAAFFKAQNKKMRRAGRREADNWEDWY